MAFVSGCDSNVSGRIAAQQTGELLVLPEKGNGERWFSFDWGFVHFVGLDSEMMGPEQVAWLEQDLQSTQNDWVVVFLRHPPFSSGSHGSNANVQELFVPLFEQYGVDLVLAGHDHHYERIIPIEGVQYIVTGGGGRGVRVPSESELTEYAEGAIHLVYVTVRRDEMRLHAVDGTGREFDGVVVPQHL